MFCSSRLKTCGRLRASFKAGITTLTRGRQLQHALYARIRRINLCVRQMEPPCSSRAGSVSPLAPRRGVNGDHRSPGGSLPSRQPNGLPYQCVRRHRQSRSVIRSALYSPDGHIHPELSPSDALPMTESNDPRPERPSDAVRPRARLQELAGLAISGGPLLQSECCASGRSSCTSCSRRPGAGIGAAFITYCPDKTRFCRRLVLSQFRQATQTGYRPVSFGGTEGAVVVRLVIADPSTMVQMGYEAVFGSSPDVRIVGQAGSAPEARRLAQSLQPGRLTPRRRAAWRRSVLPRRRHARRGAAHGTCARRSQ